MKTLKFLPFLLFFACKTTQPPIILPKKMEVKEGTGFYQFLNENNTTDSPVWAEKALVMASNGMVASAHPEASKVGTMILQKGGNAIDAAVATHFALAVVHPAAGNIGGGGFLVYRTKTGETYTLDFREKAPESASRDMYLDEKGEVTPKKSADGHLAVGVPGSVDGMVKIHEKFGKLNWENLLEPAIKLAENGILLTEREATGLNRIRPVILKNTKHSDLFPFVKKDSSDWKKDELWQQKELAQTLKHIQKYKRAGFYEGKTAAFLVAEMKRGEGLVSQKDLDNYHSVWRKAIVGKYRNYTVISMPPPSSGGVALLQLLQFVEPYPLQKWGWHTDSTTQVMIEAERRVYADRAKWLGDPDFVKVPTQELLDKKYGQKRWEDFSFDRATSSQNVSAGTISAYESPETTHFSIVDSDRNAVSITTTLNDSYGSKILVKGAGFLLNDEMDDFSAKPGVPNLYGLVGSEANSIKANKRMLSSMTPTIIEKEGKLYAVLGTPGGSTIITSVFQVFLNLVDHQMNMQQSVDALRFHHQWLPDKVVFEKNGFSQTTLQKLMKRGYVMESQKNTIGRMDCIRVLENGKLEGGSDSRGDNTSWGY